MKLLFTRRHRIEPKEVVNPRIMALEKRYLNQELLKIKESADTISLEAKKMKKKIDVALQIAQATGGITR